jgi:hypothetical protein
MLSFNRGNPIAKLSGKKNEYLRIFDPDNYQQELQYGDDDYYGSGSDYDDSDSYSSEEEYKTQYHHKGGKQSKKNNDLGTEYNCKSCCKLIPLPNLEARSVDYVAGPSGSGKSTITADMATEFKKKFPRRPIYIFSRTDARDDPAYRHLKPKQIDLDTLLEYPIDVTREIEGGCLMIFDDCQTIQNPELKKEVDKLMEDAMEVGRKIGCWMIISNHLVVPNEKKLARTIMNEMHSLTVFPKSGSSQQIRYALKTYFGLNNKQINKILESKSRWVRINKSYPMYVVHSGGAYIL